MLHSKGWTFVIAALALVACEASAQKIVPSPLLAIDQNRSTVVERIVGEWGDRLAASNAGITSAQLREILTGLRSDHLLAASLAGNVEGLRNVVASALVQPESVVSRTLLQPKSLGDTGDDLVYTPVTPCRILDTRYGTVPPYNSVMVGGAAFPVAANLATFAPQGGSVTNCGLPASFQAIAVTFTVLNPNFDAFMAASNTSDFATLTRSVVMDFSANRGLANTAIVPVDGTVTFYLGLPASVTTHVIADVQGYLRRPNNYGGTHIITGTDATDSGGYQNTASGDDSTVAGGYQNTASGFGSTVAGGGNNTASGYASTVGGGLSNTASGIGSFAAGYFANANANGCVVFSDHSSLNVTSCFTPNTFVVRALSGFFFLTGGTNDFNYTGAELPSGSSAWAAYSDRNGKDNIERVDARQVLAKLAAIPVATWNWKAQDARIRHMGPMAQDFHAAFGLGEDDKHITMVDSEGVALAAIQGLHQMMRQKDREIARLKARGDALERDLVAIKAKLGM